MMMMTMTMTMMMVSGVEGGHNMANVIISAADDRCP